MATIAIGDIHGNRPALDDLLAQLHPEVGRGDTVVFLGDYIDRGPDSRGCIDAILEFIEATDAEVVCLRGNHEDWLLRTRDDYSRHSWLMGMDGLVTVRSYSTAAEQSLRDAMAAAGLSLFTDRCDLPYRAFFEAMPASHDAFLTRLVLSFRTGDCLCTHGGLDTRLGSFADQTAESLIWGGGQFPDGYSGDRPLVYGHWHNATLDANGWPQPLVIGETIGIDTIAHGVLTAIRMPERRIFQSARHGPQ